MSALAAIMSTIFPFPSSPHCDPRTTVTGCVGSVLGFLWGAMPFNDVAMFLFFSLDRAQRSSLCIPYKLTNFNTAHEQGKKGAKV